MGTSEGACDAEVLCYSLTRLRGMDGAGAGGAGASGALDLLMWCLRCTRLGEAGLGSGWSTSPCRWPPTPGEVGPCREPACGDRACSDRARGEQSPPAQTGDAEANVS